MQTPNKSSLELIYQQKQLLKLFEIGYQQIDQSLQFVEKQFNHLSESKKVITKEINNLMVMFNTLNYDRKTPINQNASLKDVENLISALIDKKTEKQKLQHLQQLLIILAFINSNNLVQDLQKTDKQILIDALNQLGIQKINFEEFLNHDLNSATDADNVDQQENQLHKYQKEIDSRYCIDQLTIQQIYSQRLIPLQNQFKYFKEILIESNIEKMNLQEIQENITNLQNLLESSFQLIQDYLPAFKNINILTLRIQELRFLGLYRTSDRQIIDIMNVIYINKKRFFQLIIKLYESDMQSTERDIQIVELIQMIVEEIQQILIIQIIKRTEINKQFNLWRSQQFVTNVNIHFQFGSDTVSTNCQSINIPNYLKSCIVSTQTEHIKIDSHFSLQKSESMVIIQKNIKKAKQVEQDFIQIKEQIQNDLKIAKEKHENFEKQFSNFIEEKNNIKQSEKMENIQKIQNFHSDLQFKFNHNAINYQNFYKSFLFQRSPDQIFIFKIQDLLNLVSDNFKIPKSQILDKIKTRVMQTCKMQKSDQIMNIFIPYIYLFEEISKLLDENQAIYFQNFIAEWMINERVKSFSYIIISEQYDTDENEISLTDKSYSEKSFAQKMELFKKCWISELCFFQNISYLEAEQQFVQQFNPEKIKDIKSKIGNFSTIQSDESIQIQKIFRIGSNFHQGLQLLEKK